jgi:hypothetical protein
MTLKTIIRLFLVLLIFSCNTDNKNQSQNARAASDTVELSVVKTNKFTAILYESFPITGCGVMKFCYSFKFDITANKSGLDKQYIVVIQPCPDFFGEDFFKAGRSYEITTNEIADSCEALINMYEKEYLPTYWAKTIRLQK